MKRYRAGLAFVFTTLLVMTAGCANPFPQDPSDYQIGFEPHTVTIKFNYQMETEKNPTLKLEDLFNFSLQPAVKDASTTCGIMGPVINNGEASCTVTLKEKWPPLEVETLQIVATTAASPEEIADNISGLTEAEKRAIIQQLRSSPISFSSAPLDISDIDSDGVANTNDSCIDVEGTEENGCPKIDKCPTLLGIQTERCPEAAPEDEEEDDGSDEAESTTQTSGDATRKTPVFDPSYGNDETPQKTLVQRNIGPGGDGCRLNPSSPPNATIAFVFIIVFPFLGASRWLVKNLTHQNTQKSIG